MNRFKVTGLSLTFLGLMAALISGCAVGTQYTVGDMIPGRIISLSTGTLYPMQIQLSYGSGRMTATNSTTGEYFEGTYTAISDARSVQYSRPTLLGEQETYQAVEKSNATPASAVLVGNKGTILNIKMQIQAGNPPIGYGEAEDNKGGKYNVQF